MTSPPFYRGVPPLQSNSYVLALENLNRFVCTTKASKNYIVEILNDFGLNGGRPQRTLAPEIGSGLGSWSQHEGPTVCPID